MRFIIEVTTKEIHGNTNKNNLHKGEVNILDIKNCTAYLEGNYFTDVTFISEEQGNLYFTAQDEDEDQLAYIMFEYANDDSCFVNVKYGENDSYMTLEKLVK